MERIVVYELEEMNKYSLRDRLKKSEVQNYEGIFEDRFNELLVFVEDYTKSGADDEVDSYDIVSIRQNRALGKYVKFGCHVGLIQLKSGLQIEILPKIKMDDSTESDKRSKKIFLQMLKSMEEFKGKSFNISNLSIDDMNLYEIFINLYLAEADALIKRGLKSEYLQVEENLSFCKGKLSVKDQIRKNLVHLERFYVKYDEYSLNRPENKIIKSTLLKLHDLSGDVGNKKLCRHILSYFENIDCSINHDADFAKVRLDRTTRGYENLIQWSKVFLKNKSFTTFAGGVVARALLFPMQEVFEKYVAKQMKKVFNDYRVATQDMGYYLFNEPDMFRLKPDIVVTSGKGMNRQKVVMDTKWKALNRYKEKFGILQSDLYQMYAYAKKYNASDVWLLYPLTISMKNELKEPPYLIKYTSKEKKYGGRDVNVMVFLIDLNEIFEEGNINKSLGMLKDMVDTRMQEIVEDGRQYKKGKY